MSKVIPFLLTIVGIVILSVASSLGYHYYIDKNVVSEDADLYEVVDNQIDKALDPVFNSHLEVLQYRNTLSKELYEDSVFIHIPTRHLREIATVIINKKGSARVRDIVQEYNENYEKVYKYLNQPDEPVPQPAPDTPADTVKLPKLVTEDTIIDGKRLTIIKQTVANE